MSPAWTAISARFCAGIFWVSSFRVSTFCPAPPPLKALAKVGLEGRAHHVPSELSGGQQQRVAIARAIVTKPGLILADEPTGNLDSARSREIMALLAQLNRDEGLSVLMVTHEPDMAAYAHRIVTFFDGRIQSDHQNEAIHAA
jgi:putative ABC transport system ATP-binding protein